MTTNVDMVLRSIEAHLDLEPGSVRPGMDLLDDLGADSLDIVEIMMNVEELLDIEIPDEAVTDLKLRDVDNLIKYIESV